MTVRARLNRRDSGVHRPSHAGRRVRPVMYREPGAGTAVHAEVARMHEGGPPQDQAVYTCECGYVFEAMVSTSVACPHCGSAQAW
jgi:rubrerythrin